MAQIDDDPENFIDRARNSSLAELSERGIGGVLLAIATAMTTIVISLSNAISNPIESLGQGSGDIIAAFTSEPATAQGDTFSFAAFSLTQGEWAFLGPFTPILMAVVLLGVLWLFLEFLDRRNSDLPGLGVDLPGLGNDSDGQED